MRYIRTHEEVVRMASVDAGPWTIDVKRRLKRAIKLRSSCVETASLDLNFQSILEQYRENSRQFLSINFLLNYG